MPAPFSFLGSGVSFMLLFCCDGGVKDTPGERLKEVLRDLWALIFTEDN